LILNQFIYLKKESRKKGVKAKKGVADAVIGA